MPQLDLYRGLGQVITLLLFFCRYFFSVKYLILPAYFRKYKFWAKRKILFENIVLQVKKLALVLTKTQEQFYMKTFAVFLTFLK